MIEDPFLSWAGSNAVRERCVRHNAVGKIAFWLRTSASSPGFGRVREVLSLGQSGNVQIFAGIPYYAFVKSEGRVNSTCGGDPNAPCVRFFVQFGLIELKMFGLLALPRVGCQRRRHVFQLYENLLELSIIVSRACCLSNMERDDL